MSFPFVAMDSSETIQADGSEIDSTSSRSGQEETMIDASLERRDDGAERRGGMEFNDAMILAYRFVDYAHGCQRRSDGTQRSHWDEILDLHQSIEARDDNNRGDNEPRNQANDEVIVHKSLLRRRHIRKLQKERAAKLALVNSATTQGPAVATSPIQKKSIALPPINTSSANTNNAPRAFFGGQAPSHSPIQARRKVNCFITQTKGCDRKKHDHLQYPQMSPIRCHKRQKLISTSPSADVVVMG